MSERTMTAWQPPGCAAEPAGKAEAGAASGEVGPADVEETGEDDKRKYTVQQIADEFSVTRPPSTGTVQGDLLSLTSTAGQRPTGWATLGLAVAYRVLGHSHAPTVMHESLLR